jgi:hypothetical protein
MIGGPFEHEDSAPRGRGRISRSTGYWYSESALHSIPRTLLVLPSNLRFIKA